MLLILREMQSKTMLRFFTYQIGKDCKVLTHTVLRGLEKGPLIPHVLVVEV